MRMDEHLVFAVVTLPPPTHGQSYITKLVLERLSQKDIALRISDLSPGKAKAKFLYHLNRTRKVCGALACVFLYFFQYRKRTLYTLLEGGRGVFYNFIVCLCARICGYRIFLHHHSALHAKTPRFAFRLLQRIAGKNVCHIVLSDRMAADLKQTYPALPGRVVVSGNACHLPVPATSGRCASDQPSLQLGMLSNLTVHKGVLTVLETALAAHEEGLDITLTLAGAIMDDAVSSSVDQARSILKGRLRVVGPLYGQDKEDFFLNTDVFLFPSQYAQEAQPVVILEAFAYGCLVMATDRGYIAEMIGDAGTVISAGADFPALVVPMLREIVEGKSSFSSTKSYDRFAYLYAHSQEDFEVLLKDIAVFPSVKN